MVRLAPLLLLALVGSAAAARELQGMQTVGAMADGARDVAGTAVGAAGNVAGAMESYVDGAIQGLMGIHEAKVGARAALVAALLCSALSALLCWPRPLAAPPLADTSPASSAPCAAGVWAARHR